MGQASARHILVSSEDECNDLKQQIIDGSDFADLASAHSQCPSGKQGGDLGSFSLGQMVPEFDTVVFSSHKTPACSSDWYHTPSRRRPAFHAMGTLTLFYEQYPEFPLEHLV